MAFSYEKNGINVACYRVTYIGEINMITSATTVNTVYGQSAVNSTTNNKADAASFAAAFANASSTPATTTSTASADKVTISAQAQQVSDQDDIEAEAQAMAKKAIDSPYWQQGIRIVGWGGDASNLSPANQKLMDGLDHEFNLMFGTPSANTPRFKEVKEMKATLASCCGKQDFNEVSLKRETQVLMRSQEIVNAEWAKQHGTSQIDDFSLLF